MPQPAGRGYPPVGGDECRAGWESNEQLYRPAAALYVGSLQQAQSRGPTFLPTSPIGDHGDNDLAERSRVLPRHVVAAVCE